MNASSRQSMLTSIASMLKAANIGVVELAQHMGVNLVAAPALPAVKAKPGPAEVLGDHALQVVVLADRPEGVTMFDVMELLGVRHATAAYHCDRLARDQKLTKAKVGGERSFRFFAQPEHAEAYVEAHRLSVEQAQADAEHMRQVRAQQKRERAAAAVREALEKVDRRRQRTAVVVKREKPDKPRHPQLIGDAIYPENVKCEVDDKKRPNNRLEAAPDLPPDDRFPSFSSTPPGKNPITGGAWA